MSHSRIAATVLAFSLSLTPAAEAQRARDADAAAALPNVDIPYETFTLENGLRVIVSTDRKAPVVAVGCGMASARATSAPASRVSRTSSSI